jgi:hypothetical protein
MAAKRVKIPKMTRRLEAARRLVAGLRGDVADTFTRKTRTGETETVKRNPWPRCEACLHRFPPEAFVCGKPMHSDTCNPCCGGPHDDEDERDEGDQERPVRAEDEDDEEKDDDDHHH